MSLKERYNKIKQNKNSTSVVSQSISYITALSIIGLYILVVNLLWNTVICCAFKLQQLNYFETLCILLLMKLLTVFLVQPGANNGRIRKKN